MSKTQNLYALKVSVSNIKKHEFYEKNNLAEFLNDFYNILKRYKPASNYRDIQEDLRRNGAPQHEIDSVMPYIFKSVGKYEDDDGKTKEREFEYKFIDFECDKLTKSIKGRIHKEYDMFRNIIVEGELKAIPVENNEIIDFYYSMEDEKIIFYRKQRFGHKEIVTAIEAFLNQYVMDEFKIECILIREGLDISDLKSRIESEKDIVKLTLKYKVPNMPLRDAQAFQDQTDKAVRERMKEGNVKEIEETYRGHDGGIEGKAEIISDAIDRATSMIPEEADKYATSHQYLAVNYERSDGTKESTETSKAKTIEVEEVRIKGNRFIETAKSLLNNF